MRRFIPVVTLMLLLMGAMNGGCASKDTYEVSLVFTSDCTGYLEDCG